MAEPCRERLGDLAAAALGRLTPEERQALDAHLEGCPACRVELADLAGVGTLLGRAGTPEAFQGDPTDVPADLGDRIVEAARAERRARRRRQWVTAGTAAAGVAAAVVVAALVVLPVSDGADRTVAFEAAPGMEARAALEATAWGTEIELEAEGLERGEVYWLWLTDETGDRMPAGTFRGSPGRARVVLAAGLPLDETRRIWVTDADDRVVLDAYVHGAPPD